MKSLLVVIWVLDILNVPCMNFLDTTIPINGLAWFLIWVFLPPTKTVIREKNN